MIALRRLVVALVATTGVLIGPAALGLPGPLVIAADPPALTVVGDARYSVVPDEARVRVSVGLTIGNHKGETVTRHYWYDRAYLAIQPSASRLRVSGKGSSPSVTVVRTQNDHRLIEIRFGRRLYSGESLDLTLAFNLVDPGGSPGRAVRIGPGLVSFPVWAFASDATSGARASVVIPAGLELQHGADAFSIRDERDDGSLALSTRPLAAASDLRAYLVATGEAAFTERRVAVPTGFGDLDVTIRGWADDPGWRERMSVTVERASQALASEIGTPGPHSGLVVEEATQWALNGGAVAWDPTIGRLLVANDARRPAVVRGLAHAFLGPDALAERWAIEGLSEVFAVRALDALDLPAGEMPAWTPALGERAGPLNAWTGSVVATPIDPAHATAVELARRLVERIGSDGVRRALARLSAGTSVYQPLGAAATTGPAETADGPADWRRILDAFEAEAPAATVLDDLWADLVVRPDETPLLAERTAARDRYVATVAASDWGLPALVREALSNWRFETAQVLLDEVDGAMARRTALEATAADLSLILPDTVRPHFEAGRFAAARVEAERQAAALESIGTATDASKVDGVLAAIGLAGETADLDLERARSAFESGDLDEAVAQASAAERIWSGAEVAGRSRLTLVGLAFGTLGAILLVARLRRPKPRTIVRRRPDQATQR